MTKNIGLIDVDRHAKARKWAATIYPNIALAKIARYHHNLGDTVDWYTPFDHYDIVYMSKIFSFTPDFGQLITNADKIVRGGTGYDIYSRLPEEIDRLQPDYSIYPLIPKDTAYGFLTRGCIRRCKWCVVPRKEGRTNPYMDIDEIMIEGRTKAVLMDNNILSAREYAKEQVRKIISRGYRIDFNQGLDARLVTEEWAQLLAKVKWIDRRIRFGCDTLEQIKDCEKAISLIEQCGYKGDFFLYTMIGGDKDFKQSFQLINYWHNRLIEQQQTKQRCATYAYAQPYRDPDSTNGVIPQWQKDMAGWCNKRMIWATTKFEDFEPRKGFKCKEYFK